MNKNMNICPRLSIAAALLFATMFVSCINAEFEAPVATTDKEISFKTSNGTWSPLTRSASEAESRVLLAHNPDEDGSFGLSMTVTDGIQIPEANAPATKGVQVSAINSFDVAAYLYKNQSATTGSFFFEDQVTDGVTAEPYYWPSFGEMNFVALYPSGTVNGGVKTIADANGNLQSFDYTIPSDISQHQDLMIAVKNDVDCKNGGQVPLTFKHLLAAVQFKVGKMVATRINSLTISGVKGGTVTMTYDSANDTWNYSASSDNASYSPIYEVSDDTPNIDTYGMAEGNYITSNENGMVMFVMPQVLDNATISINYTELITGTEHNYPAVVLPTHSWEAGKTITYVINVNAETLQITIPTPPDADAHYVRIDMPFDFSGLNDYSGIRVSNVTAKASWLDDGSNTASADKQSIYMNTSLTEMQQKGYFTDELWEVRYRVNNSGDRTYSVGSENGPEKVDDNLLGDTQLNNLSGNGTLYLFLDENDGTTDRNGKVEITANVTQGGNTRTVTLGNGYFKQLCPSWNSAGIGVERFEDVYEGKESFPYGFSYNRVVTYTNTTAETLEELFESGSFIGTIAGIGLLIWLYITGGVEDEVLPDTEGLAPDFVIKGDEYAGFTKSFTLNYGALNDLEFTVVDSDGLVNTSLLYKFTGSTDLAELESQIDEALSGWEKKVEVTGSFPEDYAAYISLTRNRMREYYVEVTGSDGNKSHTRKAILHKVNEGEGTGGINETGEDIIEWYLPSIVEAPNLYETGTGNESTPISPLNGTYWSSTAGSNPSPDVTTNGYAHSYVFSNNTYVSNSSTTDRTSEFKVRAVRKKPTAN